MKLKIVEIGEGHLKDYLVAACRVKPMTKQELCLVTGKYVNSAAGAEKEEAKRALIEAHLREVIAVANAYRGAGLSFAGLIKAGNSGLIDAVRIYDGNDAIDFWGHIAWHIEGAIIDALVREKKEEKKV